MSFARGLFVEAKTAVAISIKLGRATGRPDQAAYFAMRRAFKSNKPVTLAWQGYRLAARGTDWPALQEVFIEDEYGPLTPFLLERREPVVLDLGANIGTFGLFVFAHARSAAVHSFEPSAATFAVLASNASRNPGIVWRTYQVAGWQDDGTASFANTEASTSGRICDVGNERVPTLSLASILERCGGRVDVAKIDIEGAEEALLVDRARELAAIDTMVVELHPDRCDGRRVARALSESYGQLHSIPGRRSSKPLLLATRKQRVQLPVYNV